MENSDIGRADTVIFQVGTNDVSRTRNLDYIMGEVYDLVTTAKEKFPGSRLVLSGVLRNEGVKWRRIGATNDTLEWVANRLGAAFFDPNSWIRDADFGMDGLHLNRNGTGQLGNLYSRISGLDDQSQAVGHK
jgi:lysophospholipase L1-like esterase